MDKGKGKGKGKGTCKGEYARDVERLCISHTKLKNTRIILSAKIYQLAIFIQYFHMQSIDCHWAEIISSRLKVRHVHPKTQVAQVAVLANIATGIIMPTTHPQ